MSPFPAAEARVLDLWAKMRSESMPADPALVVDALAELPGPIRDGIVAMVKAAKVSSNGAAEQRVGS